MFEFLFAHLFSILLGRHLGVGSLDRGVGFLKSRPIFHCPAVHEGSRSSTSPPPLVTCISDHRCLRGCDVAFRGGFLLPFLDDFRR